MTTLTNGRVLYHGHCFGSIVVRTDNPTIRCLYRIDPYLGDHIPQHVLAEAFRIALESAVCNRLHKEKLNGSEANASNPEFMVRTWKRYMKDLHFFEQRFLHMKKHCQSATHFGFALSLD